VAFIKNAVIPLNLTGNTHHLNTANDQYLKQLKEQFEDDPSVDVDYSATSMTCCDLDL